MFLQSFWASLPPESDFNAACIDIAGMGASKLLPIVEAYDREQIASLINECDIHGLEFHAWTMFGMVNRSAYSQEFIEEHRSWLAVNRNGQDGLDFPLWGRQIWWCPNSPGYLAHYIERWNCMLADLGAHGLHLDFIRYPDIWDYQDGRAIERAEVPEYSFCYCPECRREFKEETGVDPLEVPLDPTDELYQEWRRWRMNVIVRDVRAIRGAIHPELKLSAAVFPTPEIARTVVLQDWPSFADQLDFICTMIYAQKQWGKPITWVKDATEEGLAEMAGKCACYAGFGYPIKDQTPDDLRAGMLSAAEGGADGVVIFHYPGLTPEQKEALILANESLTGH